MLSPAAGFADEPAAARESQASAASAKTPTAFTREPTDDELSAIKERIDEALRARAEENSLDFAACFDVRRLMKEIGNRGGLAGYGIYEILAMRLTYEVRLLTEPDTFLDPSATDASKYRLGHVRLNSDGSEACVFVNFEVDQATMDWQALWLIQRNGTWRIYNHEDLELGTGIVASVLEEYGPTAELRQQHVLAKSLVDQYGGQRRDPFIGPSLASASSFDRAHSLLARADRCKMHPITAARRWLYEGIIDLDGGNARHALQCLAKARKLNDSLAIVPYYETLAHDYLGEHEAVVTSGREFLERVGPDGRIFDAVGKALVELERFDEAAEVYRSALAADADDKSGRIGLTNLIGLASALPAGKKGELDDYFRAMKVPESDFVYVVSQLYFRQDAEAMHVIVAAYRKLVPESTDADYHEAMALSLEKKFDEAADLLATAMKRVNSDSDREQFETAWLEAMTSAGKALQAYRASDEPRRTFRRLAELMELKEKPDELHELVATHRQRFPRDPWTYYYLGQAEAGENHIDAADEILAEGMRATVEAETLEALRERRVAIAFDAGRALEAYEKVQPRRATFVQLARLYAEIEADDEEAAPPEQPASIDRKPSPTPKPAEKAAKEMPRLDEKTRSEKLTALIAAHRKADPGDPAIPLWQGEAAWLAKDYAAVVAALASLSRSDDQLDPNDEAGRDDILIRSLVRLKRFDEAADLAVQVETRKHNPMYRLVVHVAEGNVTALFRDVRTNLMEDDYSLGKIYDDPDMGPSLNASRFDKFRERYPPPNVPKAERPEAGPTEE